MATYAEKLRDPRWQKMRLQVMGRDEFKCRACGSATETLNVHHSYYTKWADPWDYPLAHLVTLCESCHKSVETRRTYLLQFTADPKTQVKVLAFTLGCAGKVSPEMAQLCSDFSNFIKASFEFSTAGDAEARRKLDERTLSMQTSLFHVREAVLSRNPESTNQQDDHDEIPL